MKLSNETIRTYKRFTNEVTFSHTLRGADDGMPIYFGSLLHKFLSGDLNFYLWKLIFSAVHFADR